MPRATNCYMTSGERGVAFDFWTEVEKRRLDLGWEKQELAKRSGMARSTIDGLRSGKRPPRFKTIHALADLLHIDRDKAEQLAGLTERPPEPGQMSVRDAIVASPEYTQDQKEMLLAMLSTIDRANGATRDSST